MIRLILIGLVAASLIGRAAYAAPGADRQLGPPRLLCLRSRRAEQGEP